VPPDGRTATAAAPVFKWSKVNGATRYELRGCEDSQLGVTVIELRRLMWELSSGQELHKNVDLSLKVRASNSSGSGLWSTTIAFRVVTN